MIEVSRMDNASRKWQIKQTMGKYMPSVAIMSGIYALGISAILRANFYYIDDIGRALWGYKEWQYFSRYIPQYASTLIHADSHLTDISPLPQLIAVLIMAISAVIVLRTVTGKESFSFVEYAAMVPLGLSPYFLECFSYKFDSPYMAFSILASVLPILFYKRGMLIYASAIVIGMLCMCMSYQAASGIFPMLVVILCFKMWSDGEALKDILKFAAISAAAYLAGILIFALLIMKPTDVYVSNAVPSIREIIPHAGYYLKEYYYYVLTDFKKEWLILFAALCVGFLYVTVLHSKRKWYQSLPMGVLVLALLALLAFGLYPILEKPSFEPRAMYGFGVCICFIALYTVTHKKAYWAKIVCIALCWCFFVFGFTYGNALDVQKTYTDYRISVVIDDLDELDILDEENEKVVQITGSIGKASPIEGMRQDFQMLNRLIPITFRDSSWEWGRFGFTHYYGLRGIKWDPEIDLTTMDLPVLEESIYHTIRGNSDYLLIQLWP